MTELWKAVKEFVVSSKVDHDFDKITNLWTLYIFLQDGNVLCDILNQIVDFQFCKCIKSKKYSENRAIANIGQFLGGCRHFLEMKNSELFEPADLHDGLNMKKVFMTLSVMSQKDTCKNKKIKYFFFPPNTPALIIGKGDFMNESVQTPNKIESDFTIYEAPNFEGTESLYLSADTFVGEKSTFSVEIQNQHDKYQQALAEFMNNEKTYFVYNLTLLSLIYDYLAGKISFSELDIIFNNFQNLKNAQNEISQSFNKICCGNGDVTIAHTIIKYKKNFLQYVPYISKLNSAISYAENISNNPKIQKGIHDVVKRFDRNARIYDLKSLLPYPFQQILRYELLLETMIKHSSNNEKRKQELIKGKSTIQNINKLINTCEADEESLHEIKLLQSRLNIPKNLSKKFERIEDFGHILFQGEFKVMLLAEPTKIKSKSVILFDTKLIIAKNVGYSLKVEQIYNTDDYRFTTTFGWNKKLDGIVIESETDDSSYDAKIIFEDDDLLKSSFIKNMDDFKFSNFLSEQDKRGHSLRLTTFEKFEECHLCKTYLYGLLCQGYKCHNGVCGIILHQSCLHILKQCSAVNSIAKGGQKSQQKQCSTLISSIDSIGSPTPESLNDQLWFHGILLREAVIELFQNKQSGYFIVRESNKNPNNYVISVMYAEKIRHIMIQECGGYFIKEFRSFPSIKELVAYYQIHTIKEGYEKYDTKLLRYPKGPCNSIIANKDSVLYNSDCIKFKCGDLLKVWSNYFPDIWVVGIGNNIGNALSICFK